MPIWYQFVAAAAFWGRQPQLEPVMALSDADTWMPLMALATLCTACVRVIAAYVGLTSQATGTGNVRGSANHEVMGNAQPMTSDEAPLA